MYLINHAMFDQMKIKNIEAYGQIQEMKCENGKRGNYEERIIPLQVKIAVRNCRFNLTLNL